MKIILITYRQYNILLKTHLYYAHLFPCLRLTVMAEVSQYVRLKTKLNDFVQSFFTLIRLNLVGFVRW